MNVPEKPTIEGIEATWRARWDEQGTYRFDRTKSRAEIFSIDTPPPTVSGALHPGHACSFTHTDFVARYKRMQGLEVFYPMGWDDNGLNTERRVQLMVGITCDPSLPYDPDFAPPSEPPKKNEKPVPVGRRNFVEQCARVTEILEEAYFELWSDLGLSVDWAQTYTTIGAHARRTSQAGFIDLVERDIAYRAESPTLWDVDFKTAVAQAELTDKQLLGAYHRLRFESAATGQAIHIETTRPELLPACVALVAHPDDERYRSLFGTDAVTPLFGVAVPILAHELAEPDKGSGIAMVCTFGDTTDVTWWRELRLGLRAIIEKDGTLSSAPPAGIDGEKGRAAYAELAGKGVKQAQRRIVELLAESGELEGEAKPIEHPVKFWENGSRPLEIVTNRQWFVRYPDKQVLLELGAALHWWPDFMRVRYENWVNGLIGDWNVSRQRFSGVPFPAWYPIAEDGTVQHDAPIFATRDVLPVDPSSDLPPGYGAEQRDEPGGFTGDPDVMDTWATSSLTPLIAGHWVDDPDLFARVFPMDMRPQAHDIIRTWLFYSVVRSHYAFGELPWRHVAISGFVADPERKKLSKSSGNAADDPHDLLREYGADAVRYWAAGGRPGQDTVFDRNQFKEGRRLAIKLLNASKFALGLGEAPANASIDEPIDRAMLGALADVVDSATVAFDSYDYARALERVEGFFWDFCNDHLELVKGRAYGSGNDESRYSALLALRSALDTMLRLFAPFLPFVTEEVWSWWKEGSIHRAPWPSPDTLRAAAGEVDPAVREVASGVLTAIRKAKSDAKVSMRAEVKRVLVFAPAKQMEALWHVSDDLRDAGKVEFLDGETADELNVIVTLAPLSNGSD
ncbi:MAG: valine--tRNA ligase [Acidimicrobiales bacterium]